MDKSYVTMEKKVCAICLQEYDTNVLLLDRRLRKTFDRYTTTGYGICPDHQKKLNEGYVALLGVIEEPIVNEQGKVKIESAQRSGEYALIKKEACAKIFAQDVDIKDMCFVHQELINKLREANEHGTKKGQAND